MSELRVPGETGDPEPACDSSVFDRSLCYCDDDGVMHTYSCQLPLGHAGEHWGHDPDYACGPCTWSNNNEVLR